ncbi:four helix bundle protein [Pinibacter aurantiacus]|uniref:Four helix bundle protein n=1 Tax=Pinibacter aurantiacus TaxID=2851599 RepID=A0A9E2SAZ3_9BACT|nr:four helix bundle protein [Pinibacter aurantiacus]MBV4358123.1 four helix bundle protein [Pinibacter aurantiacus]
MFLQLNHQKLHAYTLSRLLVKECYIVVKRFPPDERFALIQQIKRASLSVCLNIAEGASRKSEQERKRFYEIARGSIVEIDAAFDLANDLGYCSETDVTNLSPLMKQTFAILSKLITMDTGSPNFRNP